MTFFQTGLPLQFDIRNCVKPYQLEQPTSNNNTSLPHLITKQKSNFIEHRGKDELRYVLSSEYVSINCIFNSTSLKLLIKYGGHFPLLQYLENPFM